MLITDETLKKTWSQPAQPSRHPYRPASELPSSPSTSPAPRPITYPATSLRTRQVCNPHAIHADSLVPSPIPTRQHHCAYPPGAETLTNPTYPATKLSFPSAETPSHHNAKTCCLNPPVAEKCQDFKEFAPAVGGTCGGPPAAGFCRGAVSTLSSFVLLQQQSLLLLQPTSTLLTRIYTIHMLNLSPTPFKSLHI